MNSKLIIRNVWRFLVLVLLQVLVFNNIYLGGYINPCLYVLFIAMLPTSMDRIPMMLVAFATGLCIDVSANMLGFHTFACVAVAFLRPIWLDRIMLSDSDENVDTPSLRSVPYQQFALYLFFLLLVFNLVYYSVLVFNMRELPMILLASLLSTIVTWILAILYQTLLLRKKE